MDISFVPALQHMCCVKIVTSLFKDKYILRFHQQSAKELAEVKSKLTEDISKLIRCNVLQRKLESFIMPLLYEIENWRVFSETWTGWKRYRCDVMIRDLSPVRSLIEQCWLQDGTLDKEKLMSAVLRNPNVKPLDKFEISCLFCIFEDVVRFWNDLYATEKAYLRNQCDVSSDLKFVIIGPWIEWLQNNNVNKDWESFVNCIVETSLWKNNAYVLKHVLRTLSPTERGQYLVRALIENQTCIYVMRFGLPMLTPDEREVIFRENTSSVLRCISSWPLRCAFSDMAENLWPYITEDMFSDFLKMILKLIKDEERDSGELLVVLQSSWAQSPANCKQFVQNDSDLCGQINFLLECDLSQEFPREKFLRKFYYKEYSVSIPFSDLPIAELQRLTNLTHLSTAMNHIMPHE